FSPSIWEANTKFVGINPDLHLKGLVLAKMLQTKTVQAESSDLFISFTFSALYSNYRSVFFVFRKRSVP
ncbi:hypothetical protein ACVBKF_04510, partial [Shewanella sp. 0m-11]